ncbi:MAG: hypothetical protein RSC49_00010 [Clostridium sp.]
MGKLKKSLIVSAILIIVGIVGAIPSAVIAVPKFLSDVENKVANEIKNYEVSEVAAGPTKTVILDLEYDNYYVRILDSKDDKVHISGYKTKANNLKINQKLNEKDRSLRVNFDRDYKYFSSLNFSDGLVGAVADALVIGSGYSREVQIYLPQNIDLIVERGENAFVSTQESGHYLNQPIEEKQIYNGN